MGPFIIAIIVICIIYIIARSLAAPQKGKYKGPETKGVHGKPKKASGLKQKTTTYNKLSGKKAVKNEFVVVDLETTGFNPERNAIIEIAAIKVNIQENHQATYSALINPGRKVTEKITRLTGITNGMIKNSPSIADVMPRFLKFIGDLPLVFHNAPFDMGFLVKNAKALGFQINNSIIDTLPLSRRAFPDLDNHKLPTIINHLGIKTNRSHRALDDCLSTLHVYTRSINLVNVNNDELMQKLRET